MKPGRKKLPPDEKRRMITVKLPPAVIEWLRANRARGSQAELILEALREKYDVRY